MFSIFLSLEAPLGSEICILHVVAISVHISISPKNVLLYGDSLQLIHTIFRHTPYPGHSSAVSLGVFNPFRAAECLAFMRFYLTGILEQRTVDEIVKLSQSFYSF